MLQLTFENHGLSVTTENNFFIVNNSEAETRERIGKIVEEAKFFPIFSGNSLNGQHMFVVCPYQTPPLFDAPDLHQPPRSDVFDRIARQAPKWAGNRSVTLSGMHFDDRREFWAHYGLKINKIPALLHSFLHGEPGPGKALEHGCGYGAASLFLSKRGWQVVAVDSCSQALTVFKGDQNIVAMEKKVEEFEFDEKFDLIVTSNILEFIDPSQFSRVWDRIYHAIKEGGFLVGSLKKEIADQKVMEISRELGNWHVRDVCDVTSLFSHYSYKIKTCRYAYSNLENEPMRIEFLAQKS